MKIICAVILFVLFRFHIFAFLGIKEYSRFAILLPLATVAFFHVISFSWQKNYSQMLWPLLGTSLFLATTCYLVAIGDMNLDAARSIFFHKIIGLLFLALILGFNLSLDLYKKSLTWLSLWIVFLGSLASILEALGYQFSIFSEYAFVSFFMPEQGHIEGWTLKWLTYDNKRVLGFCFGPHESAFSILSAWVYLNESGFKNKILGLAATFLAFWAIFESATFIILIILCLYGAYKYRSYLYFEKFKKSWPMVLTAFLALAGFFFTSPFMARIDIYQRHWLHYYETLAPGFEECHAMQVLGLAYEGMNCTVPEVKVLSPMFVYGPFSLLPYYLLVLLPLLRYWRPWKIGESDKPFFATYVVLILSLSHYPAIEKWGQNFFFFLLVAQLSQPFFQKALHQNKIITE